MGRMQIENGRITGWRDHFDLVGFAWQVAAIEI
ncbi:hypothetical protein OPKNFCMD_4793 [Methylobacterium crusticola]|uniref:Uncharacterized protein n=1 Tax=Methylobacterium crusticola TaxID=1697972 RepID=A0ABQ4R424_9HYPH|nr:hypothetical protein OPKNFCMD_4793 [Methylobacterium crusticola]